MIPEIRWLYSPDVDLPTFSPDARAPWGFLLQIGLGVHGEEGEDSFDLMVCSPQWIEVHYGAEALVDGRHHLFMLRYSYSALQDELKRRVEQAAAATWDEVVSKFGEFAELSS